MKDSLLQCSIFVHVCSVKRPIAHDMEYDSTGVDSTIIVISTLLYFGQLIDLHSDDVLERKCGEGS